MPLLKRTDTRTGTDPPRKCRAASIAGARRVTSGCHLHNSEPRDRRDSNTRGEGRTGSASHVRSQWRIQGPLFLRAPFSASPTKGARAQTPEMYSRASLLGDVVQLAQTLFSRRLFLSLVNKALVSPSAGSQVFHFLQTLRLVGTSCMHERKLGRKLVGLQGNCPDLV